MSVDRLGQKWVAMLAVLDRALRPTWIRRCSSTAGPSPPTDVLGTRSPSAPRSTRPARWTRQTGRAAAGRHWFGMDTDDFGVVFPLGLIDYDSPAFRRHLRRTGARQYGSLVRAGKIRAITVDKDRPRLDRLRRQPANSGRRPLRAPPRAPATTSRPSPAPPTFDVWAMVAHGDSIWVLTDRDLRRISRSAVPPGWRTLATRRRPDRAARRCGSWTWPPNGEVYVGCGGGRAPLPQRRNHARTSRTYNSRAVLERRARGRDRSAPPARCGSAPRRGSTASIPGTRWCGPTTGLPDTVKVWPNPAMQTNGGVLDAHAGDRQRLHRRHLRRARAAGAPVHDHHPGCGGVGRPRRATATSPCRGSTSCVPTAADDRRARASC